MEKMEVFVRRESNRNILRIIILQKKGKFEFDDRYFVTVIGGPTIINCFESKAINYKNERIYPPLDIKTDCREVIEFILSREKK